MNQKKVLDYYKNDNLAADVWSSKYRLTNLEGQIMEETPDDMHMRLAKEFGRIENNYKKKIKDKYDGLSSFGLDLEEKRKDQTKDEIIEEIFNLFKDFKYIIPQGRVMSALGANEYYRSLSNCLRLPPPKDSYSSIMFTDTMLVSAAKRGCGYGLGISNLRPNSSPVKNSANTSTGAVSFMERFSNSTREVAQAGRRGACLLDIDIKHPDSFDFINSKIDRTKVTGANISVKLWDDFMESVNKDEGYLFTFPVDFDINDELVKEFNKNPDYGVLKELKKGVYVKKDSAKKYFDSIVQNAWDNAEPGVFFWDRMLDYDPSNVYEEYKIDGTNACGEQPMSVYDTCRLICLNLFSFVVNPFKNDSKLDEKKLYEISYMQMRLGDALVDLEIEYIKRIIYKINSDKEPLEEKLVELTLWENVLKVAKSGRRVGCGLTALGDMLAALGLKYDSDEAVDMVDNIMKIKMKAELDCMIDMSITRGSFKGYNKNLEYNEKGRSQNGFYKFIKNTFPLQVSRMNKYGRRNVNWSTIAPVGTTSLVAKLIHFSNTTSGCEPQFGLWFFRNKKVNPDSDNVRVDYVDQNGDSWTTYPVMMGGFKEWLMIYLDIEDPYELLNVIGNFTEEDLNKLYKKSPWYGSLANDINWEKRVKIQSVLQKYTTSAISSTINLPENVDKNVVATIYRKAWESGLKGVTVYRDGSRTGVLVNKETKEVNFSQKDAIKRPKTLDGDGRIITVRGEEYLVIIGLFDDKPYEVFASKHSEEWKVPKNFKCKVHKRRGGKYDIEIVGKEVLITDFNHEIGDEESIITRMISTSLRHGVHVKFIVEQLNKSEGDLLSFGKAVARVLKTYIQDGEASSAKCLECGSNSIIFEEGCQKCTSCGSSKCG